MIYAKKHWGQNFLIDPNILRKIDNAINPQPGEIIIEIGPGKGALTELLLKSGAEIHAIEIDKGFIINLEERFADFSNFYLYNEDALKFDYSGLFSKKQKIRFVGNIPYNITSPLLFLIFREISNISDVIFLVQKEMAVRLFASPGSKDYGILSVISQYYGEVTKMFDVSPNVFRPIPQVYSTLFSFVSKPVSGSTQFLKSFHSLVKTAFNQRRKTLKNSLSKLLPDNLVNLPIDLSRRAETLSVNEFVELTSSIFQ